MSFIEQTRLEILRSANGESLPTMANKQIKGGAHLVGGGMKRHRTHNCKLNFGQTAYKVHVHLMHHLHAVAININDY